MATDTEALDEIDSESLPGDTDETESTEVDDGSRSKMKKMAGVLLAFMVVQGTVMYFILDEFVAPAAPIQTDEEVEAEDGDDLGAKKVEVPIDKFNTTTNFGGTGTVHITFELSVTVVDGTEHEFRRTLEAHKGRVGEAVLEVCRSLKRDELGDSKLSVMKRQIRDKLNRVLGTTSIIDILIPQFEFVEQ